MSSVGVCANVNLRSLELYGADTHLTFMESAFALTSIATDPSFWSGSTEFLVFLDPNWILPGGRLLAAQDDQIADWYAARLQELAGIAGSHPDSTFVLANCVLIDETFDADVLLRTLGSTDLGQRLNDMVCRTAQALANVIPLDWAHMVATQGSSRVYDSKYWYLGRMPLSGAGSRLLWEAFRASLEMARSAPRKVLCVDLDNTLWRGVCGEEGPHGVGLSEEGVDKAYRDLQSCIKGLKDLGVLLTVNSKNNPEDALAVFRDNPMMVLQDADFAAMRINWADKAANMRSLSEELSLGLDAFVFIDDSSVEREFVRRALPEVAVPDFPAEAHELPAWFRTQVARRHFRFRAITSEDRARTELYHRRRGREVATASLSRAETIAQLQIELTVERDSVANLPRLHQMAQKTNQFNLTTIRYTETAMKERILAQDFSVWNAWYRDKFGDEGIVAMAVVSHGMPKLESFLMSCRVIGRSVEFAFLHAICEQLAAMGERSLAAEFRATAKNGPCSRFLPQVGFEGDGVEFFGDIETIIGRTAVLAIGVDAVSRPDRMEPARFRGNQ